MNHYSHLCIVGLVINNLAFKAENIILDVFCLASMTFGSAQSSVLVQLHVGDD